MMEPGAGPGGGLLADKIAGWLRDYAERAGARGYVVGLSGGVDSACTAALCDRAMAGRVLAAWLPCYSQQEDAECARLVADTFGLGMVEVDLGPPYDGLVELLPPPVIDMAKANLKARLRMATLYALGQSRGYLVAGTGNRSELLVGYYTKYGDGGVDVEPLGDLYKWQVRALARELGVPQRIIDRAPTAGLWPGQTDEAELGLTYDQVDEALAAIESDRTTQLERPVVDKVRAMVAASAHKRAMPPVYRVSNSGGSGGTAL